MIIMIYYIRLLHPAMLCDVISKYVMQAARLANKIQGFGIAIWAHKN